MDDPRIEHLIGIIRNELAEAADEHTLNCGDCEPYIDYDARAAWDHCLEWNLDHNKIMYGPTHIPLSFYSPPATPAWAKQVYDRHMVGAKTAEDVVSAHHAAFLEIAGTGAQEGF